MKRALCILILTTVLIANQSCSSDDGASNESPVNGTWRVTEVQVSQQQLTQFTPSDENVLLTFTNTDTFSGQTMVNQFSGRYELDGSTMTMLEFSTTSAADTQFAGAFYNAISEAQVPNETFAQFGYGFENQNLVLIFGNSGRMILELQS